MNTSYLDGRVSLVVVITNVPVDESFASGCMSITRTSADPTISAVTVLGRACVASRGIHFQRNLIWSPSSIRVRSSMVTSSVAALGFVGAVTNSSPIHGAVRERCRSTAPCSLAPATFTIMPGPSALRTIVEPSGSVPTPSTVKSSDSSVSPGSAVRINTPRLLRFCGVSFTGSPATT